MPAFVTMNGFLWLVLGLAVAAAGRFALPRGSRPGWLPSLVAAVAGAFLGGLVSTLLGFGGLRGLDGYSLIVAALGAILLLVVAGILQARAGGA